MTGREAADQGRRPPVFKRQARGASVEEADRGARVLGIDSIGLRKVAENYYPALDIWGAGS